MGKHVILLKIAQESTLHFSLMAFSNKFYT